MFILPSGPGKEGEEAQREREGHATEERKKDEHRPRYYHTISIAIDIPGHGHLVRVSFRRAAGQM
jgi:hypothetical protein